MRQRPKSSRRRQIFTGIALIGMLGGRRRVCEHPELDDAGANTLEGGVKIPTVGAPTTPTDTTVNVTLGDTNGAAGPMTLTVVTAHRARR